MKGSRFIRQERRDAEIERLRTVLLKVVSNRFGAQVSADISAAVQSVNDLQQLERLFDQLLAAGSLDDFWSALPTARTPH